MISIIFGYRDRETARLQRCLESLSRQSHKDFEVIFIDYGSDHSYQKKAKAVVTKYDFCRYIYSETQGRPWSRSHSLNIGMKLSEREYVFTCDIDMLFPSNLMEKLAEKLDQNSFWHVYTNYLEPNFSDWDNIDKYPLKTVNYGGRGILVIPRKVVFEIQGYDEHYYHWGCEDNDLHHRLKLSGLEYRVEAENIFLHHQWHPISYSELPSYIPQDLDGEMYLYYYKNKRLLSRNGGKWGQLISREDRPILNYFDIESYSLSIENELVWFDEYPRNYFVQQKLVKLLYRASSGSLLAINGARYSNFASSAKRGLNFLNRLMYQKFKLNFGLYICENPVHRFLLKVIRECPDLVEDYYLNFPIKRGVSFILRK